MAATQHAFPVFETLLANKSINLTSDTLDMGLIASGTFTWGATPEGYEFVSQFLAGDGTHGALTECTGGNYARITLSGVTFTQSGENVTLTATNPAWANLTQAAMVYAFLYDASVGANDAAHPILGYWDFGGAQSVSAATFTLTVGANGLLQWQYQ